MHRALQFYETPYRSEISAQVIGIENNRIILDRTVFFPTTVILPGDSGTLRHGPHLYRVNSAVWTDETRSSVTHLLDDKDHSLSIGSRVMATIDWTKRHLRMRAHTALHLVASVLPYPVVGGGLYDGYGHRELHIVQSGMERHHIESAANYLIERELDIKVSWLQPHASALRLADTTAPTPLNAMRMIGIGHFDPQPCQGLHVRNTSEVGALDIPVVEKIGGNRWRIWVSLQDACKGTKSEISVREASCEAVPILRRA